ncbi:GNAT family N-acetyltransferase [Thalassotalea sp. PP2-459]|uniref:GNAT family N-acetyltransferase n=1 Tax=Thalassotalea sp. PP2-459 TaxID=1742724 RepID=UPI000941CFC6|nr:GNAT family N-acetyltransferase [Thalassotalea sp. PP2-459]OKY27936.1 GNAT family N-acetyltransferase [Thalassotalea sp. PP2-459]
MHWLDSTFNELTLDQLYDLLKLRVDVFVVEQTCYYPELDNLDRHIQTRHIMAYKNEKLAAYLRVLPAGTTYSTNPAIGRVVIANDARGNGLGHQLMQRALSSCQQYFPQQIIKMSAQEHLETFYNAHGFVKCSSGYLEDGIPHISMIQETK